MPLRTHIIIGNSALSVQARGAQDINIRTLKLEKGLDTSAEIAYNHVTKSQEIERRVQQARNSFEGTADQ
jgi:hypothetical protein